MEHWSHAEKRLARAVFEAAAQAEDAELLQAFKAKAAAAASMEEAWSLGKDLEESLRDFQRKYDYRYSQLLYVFARLVREGRVRREQLDGLSPDKLAVIDRILSL